jgi:hypothetical protein
VTVQEVRHHQDNLLTGNGRALMDEAQMTAEGEEAGVPRAGTFAGKGREMAAESPEHGERLAIGHHHLGRDGDVLHLVQVDAFRVLLETRVEPACEADEQIFSQGAVPGSPATARVKRSDRRPQASAAGAGEAGAA